MGLYAKNTDVSPDRTMIEIRETLRRYKASKIATLEEDHEIGIAFEMSNRRVRFVAPLPRLDEHEKDSRGKRMGKQQADESYQKAIRQRWRGLLLVIKAKLESVAAEIETFDEAFMAQIVLPSGETIGQWAAPQIEASYRSGNMPPLLGSGTIAKQEERP
jgi:hypothetical protein